jgi:diguanylate cyclase (GGDEF)-like protein
MVSARDSQRLEAILAKLPEEDSNLVKEYISTDFLTGVYNRKKYDYDLKLIVHMSERSSKGASFLMVDVDNFKKYNDTHGHKEGDILLKRITECITDSLRDYDALHIYRYGGEEFVILIPDSTTKDGIIIANRLRCNVQEKCEVTVSIGVSHYREISKTIEELEKNADKALYNAKNTGKNRVILYGTFQ